MTLSNASIAKLPVSSRLERSESLRAAVARRAQTTRWLGRVSFALPLVGLAAGAWLLSRGSERRPTAYGVLGAAVGLGALRWQLQRLVTEEMPYVVEARLGAIEVRRYPEQVWAETVVEDSSWSEALNEGFRRLAGYIFGANDGQESLGITTPVLSALSATVQPGTDKSGEKLSMTTPVFATLGAGAVGERTVAFVMPGDRELRSLPKPRDPRVRLRAIPERLVAALPFTGDYESGSPQQKREELLSSLAEAGRDVQGEASFAGYDPPSTLPALRRNEVMIELSI